MKKLKMTNQRQLILEYLKSVDTHPSAEEVYEAVRKKLPRISLGTVYRNLNTLSEMNEIVKIDVGKGRFDAVTKGQVHLICRNCSKVIDVDVAEKNECPCPKVAEKVKGRKFKIESSRSYFYGLCDKCAR